QRRRRQHAHRQAGGADRRADAARLAAALALQPHTGTFLFCHAVVPVMKRQAAGKIVNISSIAGRGLSASSSAAYATAKGGIIALTRKLSLELGPHGINVNAIAPSLTLSPRLR